MKVVHLTNNDFDGAGRATLALHKALLNEGIDSLMLVYHKRTEVDKVVQLLDGHPIRSLKSFLKYRFQYLRLLMHRLKWVYANRKWRPKTLINFDYASVTLKDLDSFLFDADVIGLYSVQKLLSAELIRKIYDKYKKPLIWVPLDVEPLTGGCHFNGSCEKLSERCEMCPQMECNTAGDIIKKQWSAKINLFHDIPITYVAASSEVEKFCRKSVISRYKRIEKILIGVDDVQFSIGDKSAARQKLDIPSDKKVVLFGCFNLNHPRKGGQHLINALKLMLNRLTEEEKKRVVLLTFGKINGFPGNDAGCEWIDLGLLDNNKDIVEAYHACDLLACPSIDDCGPMMINEAIMCGRPVIAFNRGVAPDLITTINTGYLVKPYCDEDFSNGLYKCLFLKEENNSDLMEVRRKILLKNYAAEYIKLYKDLLNTN